MKSSRVCWRPGPSGFSRNKYTHMDREAPTSRLGNIAGNCLQWGQPRYISFARVARGTCGMSVGATKIDASCRLAFVYIEG